MPSGRSDATASSDDRTQTARRSPVPRRHVLAGVGAGLAAGVVGTAAGSDGGESHRSRPPATVWRSSPADADVNGLVAGDGVVAARTAAASFVALDPSNGRRRWRREYGSEGGELLVHRGRAYLVSGNTLLALAEDGTVRWRFAADDPAALDVTFGGDHCYVGVNLPGERRLLALSVADGRRVWRVETPATSLVHLTDDVLVTLASTPTDSTDTTTLVSYDRTDGTELWRYELGAASKHSASGDTVYVQYGGKLYAVAAADGTVQWSRSNDAFGVFVEYGGTTYLSTGMSVRGLAGDGSQRWSTETQGVAFPVGRVDGGLAFFGRTAVEVIEPDGTRRWRYEFQGEPQSRFARVVGGTVFAVDGGTIYRIEGGERTWSFDPEDGSPTTLAVGGGRLYAADRETVYAVDPDGDGGATTTTVTPTATDPPTSTVNTSTTASADSGTTGDASGTTPAAGTAGETTGTDATTTSDSGSGGSPGFGVVSVLVGALVAALRLAAGDDDAD